MSRPRSMTLDAASPPRLNRTASNEEQQKRTREVPRLSFAKSSGQLGGGGVSSPNLAQSAPNGRAPAESQGLSDAYAVPSDLSRTRTGLFVVFDLLDIRCMGVVPVSQLIGKLKSCGLHNSVIKRIVKVCDKQKTGEITFDMFCDGMMTSPYFDVVKRVVEEDLIIPDWRSFILDVKEMVKKVEQNRDGSVATYIPQLASVNPDLFGIAIQTVDGQTWSYGFDGAFSVQSVFLPVAYLLAQQQLGEERLSQYIGHEPSGRGFQSFELKDGKKPHNAMVSAGAILLMSLLHPDLPPADRFQAISSTWEDITGHCGRIEFDNSVYLSELSTADRNFALAHYMKNEGCFPPYVKTKTNLDEHMRFYFMNCSIACTVSQLVGVASTLANGGLQPLTKKQLFSPTHVKNCLSLMFSCGMYDNSGTYAYTVGFPSKGSVSGAMVMVVPGVLGVAVYSPRVDTTGSPVVGMEFARLLSSKFSFHVFDMIENTEKEDPTNHTKKSKESASEGANVLEYAMLYGAIKGDVNFIRTMIPAGVSVNISDLDGRTPLHLAAMHGNLSTVSMLLDCGAKWDALDRFGKTPVDEAMDANNKAVLSLLKDKGATVATREARLQAMMQVDRPSRRSAPTSPRMREGGRRSMLSPRYAASVGGQRRFSSSVGTVRQFASAAQIARPGSVPPPGGPNPHDKKYRTLESQ